MLFDCDDQPVQAVVPHAAALEQPTMSRRATEATGVLRVGVADGELFGELGVSHQMFPVYRITGLDRERRIGGPFASPVPSMAIYAAGTDHTGDADTETDDNHQQKPRWKG